MQVKNHGFVNVRVIGDRYLIATTLKEFTRTPIGGNMAEDGKKQKLFSKIFELKLSNETAIIGSEHLSPISEVTSVTSAFIKVKFT